MKVFITGVSGFIGWWLAKAMLARGDEVVGLDNMNAYYSVKLKEDRLTQLLPHPQFKYIQEDVAHKEKITAIFDENHFDVVIHLAAQAGVRYSLENPHVYIDSNIVGFTNILEGCRQHHVKNLVFASSSSVYGANARLPFSEHHSTEHPVSLYAATKKANELMAHCYSHLYQIPCTGLRFFTVYGPWGRPDMAFFKFTSSIIKGESIDIYNNGEMLRDFTYIEDIIDGIMKVIDNPAKTNPNWDKLIPDPATSTAPYRIYNIGSANPTPLLHFIEAIEDAVGKPAIKKFLPMQAGDVLATHADVSDLSNAFDFKPRFTIREGIKNFVDWYRTYYQ